MNFKTRLLIGYVVLILTATMLPVGNGNTLFAGADKVAHGLMFLLLGMLSSWAVPKKHVMVITGSMILAVATEILQLFIPRRSFEWRDLLADGVGVVIGWAAYYAFRKAQRSTLNSQHSTLK